MNNKTSKITRSLLVFIAALLLCSMLLPGCTAQSASDIVILYTNDVHCAIDDNIGYAGLAAYKEAMETEYGEEYVTLVDTGDAVQGNSIGALSKGEYPVQIMNKVGYDIAVFGNHEFDYGLNRLAELVKMADYKYISCNFTYTGASEPPFKLAPYEIVDYGKVKVAYVGITTPETLWKSNSAIFKDENGNYVYSFCQDEGTELYEAVQSAVDDARKEGADYVVALAHLGVEDGSEPYRSLDVIENTTGIDAVLDGHSHSTIASEQVQNKNGDTVLLSQTGTNLEAIGKLTIKNDGTIATELVSDYTDKDEVVGSFIKDIQGRVADQLGAVVAKSDVDLSINAKDGTRAVRNQETAIGDFCADAYRALSGADVAFVNGGGIRASIEKGDITYGEMIDVHPYANMLCTVEASGQEILDALELSVMNMQGQTSDGENALGESGGFLQVSGIAFTADLSVASSVTTDENGLFTGISGARRVKDVKVLNDDTGAYEAIDPNATYTVASHNYMLESMGDGYSMFADNTFTQYCTMIDHQVLITYITDYLNGVIGDEYAAQDGRITVVGG